MPLSVPQLDDRSYQQLVREALARVPVHNPEWTNFNDSDPGVTLVQLFAFMAESLLYRANQIPERNRAKFLTLLGIPLRPAEPARGLVVVNNDRGGDAPHTLRELDLRAGPVRFRTTRGLEVLPVEAQVFYKQKLSDPATEQEQRDRDTYRLLYADLLDLPDTTPAFYASAALPAPIAGAPLPVVDLLEQTVDQCLWIALLARPNESPDLIRPKLAGRTLTVGVVPALSPEGVVLPPGVETPVEQPARIVWEIANPPEDGLLPGFDVDPQGRVASYRRLDARPLVDVLAEPGLVELTLPASLGAGLWRNLEPDEEGSKDFPPSLADTDLRDRVITWVRMRIPRAEQGGTAQARVSWMGINATELIQRALVQGEVAGEGTGEPDQRLTLANVPVIPETLRLTVDGVLWYPVDDLLAAEPEVPVADPRLPVYVLSPRDGAPRPPADALVNVYLLDPEAGTITFGDGAHGRRPPRGSRIVADYAYGGGRAGNVGIGAVKSSPDLPAGFKVSNPLPTWGGADAEPVAEAEKRIPRQVQHRDRLVSVQDFKDITWRTPGVDLGRVEVVPLRDPALGSADVPGVVSLVVVPRYDPLHPEAPEPDRLFLDTICRYLQPRRLITTEIYVRGPLYVDVWVSVGIEVLPDRAPGPVIEDVKQALRAYLSPLVGGSAAAGWPLGVAVLQRELEAVTARVAGVRLVKDLLLGEATGGRRAEVPLPTLGLPRLAGLEVRLDQPASLDDVRSYIAPEVTPNQVPIPVVPLRC